jgi:single-strand DNA-binding protein
LFQKVIIAGNLGTDPELRTTQSGQTVCSFSVATNRRWTGQNGNQGEETVWFRVSVWSRQAETCHQYLSKGRQVLIEGRLSADPETGGPRIWTDKNGAARASYELTALDVRFLGGRDGPPPPREPATTYESAAPTGAGAGGGAPEALHEDEMPF